MNQGDNSLRNFFIILTGCGFVVIAIMIAIEQMAG